MTKKNKNLKDGLFRREELELYSLTEKQIEIVLEYNKKLPILQQDDTNSVDARELHKQLQVGKDFSTWIKDRVRKYGLEEGLDFSPISVKSTGGRPSIEYNLTLETAKQLAMLQNNELGNITRKYFIYIEKAFKERQLWNQDRESTIELCKELRSALLKHKDDIIPNLPKWCNDNPFLAEFCMLNDIIIGMSAKEYRLSKGLSKSKPIRNTFTDEQLVLVKELERYDADLIEVQEMFDMSERREILTKKLKFIYKKVV